MKKIYCLVSLLCLIFLSSCSPKVSTNITKTYPPIDYREDIFVYFPNDPFPDSYEKLGTIKLGDTGFTNNCQFDIVLEKAKLEARKTGANAIKITEHTPPDFVSTCHRIKADLLFVKNPEEAFAIQPVSSKIEGADYALLHIYRYGGGGALVSYDLYLGDSIIYRVKNKSKTTLKIRKDGMNTLWAKTESKAEIPVNIEFGNEYYIRCSVSMGAFVGRPRLEIVDNATGKREFESLQVKNEKYDTIIMNNGKVVECRIIDEDDENVYFIVKKDNKEIKTSLRKVTIKTIERQDEE